MRETAMANAIIASAGTLESSDCLVTVQQGGENEVSFGGANVRLFAERNRRLADGVLARYPLKDAAIKVQDQGALEVTITARLETAIERYLAMEAQAR